MGLIQTKNGPGKQRTVSEKYWPRLKALPNTLPESLPKRLPKRLLKRLPKRLTHPSKGAVASAGNPPTTSHVAGKVSTICLISPSRRASATRNPELKNIQKIKYF